jgi:hypothetical protein
MKTMQGQLVRGRPVKINLKTEKRARGSPQQTRTYDYPWKPKYEEPINASEKSYAFDRWSREDAKDHWTNPTAENRRLYVGGLPRIYRQADVNEEIRKLFKGRDVQAISKIISPHPSKRSKPGSHYYCFVDLPTAEEANDAVTALDGKLTGYGGNYQISLARGNSTRKVVREQLSEDTGLKATSWRRSASPEPPQTAANIADLY